MDFPEWPRNQLFDSWFFFNVDIIVLLGIKKTENSRINVISCANSMSGKILVLKLKSKMLPANQITASFD